MIAIDPFPIGLLRIAEADPLHEAELVWPNGRTTRAAAAAIVENH